MTKKETAEAIIHKYIKIIGLQCEHESYCKSKECNVLEFTYCKVDFKKAKECAKSEVQSIINSNPYSNPFNTQQYSTIVFWQGVLNEIK